MEDLSKNPVLLAQWMEKRLGTHKTGKVANFLSPGSRHTSVAAANFAAAYVNRLSWHGFGSFDEVMSSNNKEISAACMAMVYGAYALDLVSYDWLLRFFPLRAYEFTGVLSTAVGRGAHHKHRVRDLAKRIKEQRTRSTKTHAANLVGNYYSMKADRAWSIRDFKELEAIHKDMRILRPVLVTSAEGFWNRLP
jgi:hypothetical protein